MDVSEVLADLLAEHDALDAVVADLSAEQFATPTPSPRWTVADQLAHLTYFDANAALAITDPIAFPATVDGLFAAAMGGDEAMDEFTLGAWRDLPADELLAAWRSNRALLADAAEGRMVRTVDGLEVVLDRPLDGDLGPRSRHLRCRRCPP